MPTPRCTAPSRSAATATCCSTPRCDARPSTCWRWKANCARRCRQDQFEPYFQPILRLATDEVVGYEALLRWNHPTRGLLGPPDFLQIAEDSGAIEAIDWRMFELSCELASRLGQVGTYLTINVAAAAFPPRRFRHAT